MDGGSEEALFWLLDLRQLLMREANILKTKQTVGELLNGICGLIQNFNAIDSLRYFCKINIVI